MDLIDVVGEIVIQSKPEKVFSYLSNLENDKYWRKEITKTTMSGSPAIGVEAKEISILSPKVKNFEQNLVCIQFDPIKDVVYETQSNAPFYLKSIRKIVNQGNETTKVIYQVQFDVKIVKHGIGFSLPMFLIRYVTRRDMKKYLLKLKSNLEQ